MTPAQRQAPAHWQYPTEAGQRTDAHLTDPSTDPSTNDIRPKNTMASDRKIVQQADSVPFQQKFKD